MKSFNVRIPHTFSDPKTPLTIFGLFVSNLNRLTVKMMLSQDAVNFTVTNK